MTDHSLLTAVRRSWNKITDLRVGVQQATVSGSGLDLAELVAIARYKVTPQLSTDDAVRQRVDNSVAFVDANSQGAGASMYGVNTGVGGSGNVTRTTDRNQLQLVILKNLCSGILPFGPPHSSISYDPTFHDSSLILPQSWVKGAMLLRLNSLLRGHSGCRWILINGLHQLLVHDLVPCAPLRQSISASGDLAPLGYIAASLTENVAVKVWSGKGADRKPVPSIDALRAHGIAPITFGPKEALAVVNGTGPSCAVGALALHDASLLLLASQALTALAIEALCGTPETFDPFLHDTARPHPGQIEVSRNCRVLLAGSSLARWHDETNPEHTLRQDRYGLRTAPQWIGPQVEELMTSWRAIEIEMNSTTDNPIIDLEGQRSVHGGNFQGTSVALAMEKTRMGLQHIGKLAYAQFVELGSPPLSRGLPPDLAAWEPSLDFGVKTMDVATASYVSELSYVSNTVTNHVQAAEMHNQAVNSLALISARYTFTAIQVVQMIFANHLYALCQAIDLRAMTVQFFTRMDAEVTESLERAIDPPLHPTALARLARHVCGQARVAFTKTAHLDSEARFVEVVRPLVADVLAFLAEHVDSNCDAPTRAFAAAVWHTTLATTLATSYRATRLAYFENGSALPLLGKGTRVVYRFVRETLGVRMRTGITRFDGEGEEVDAWVSKVYYAFESGKIAGALLEAFEE